nr:MAG TPA: hypothetical protein [Bacteriophage sp.]
MFCLYPFLFPPYNINISLIYYMCISLSIKYVQYTF